MVLVIKYVCRRIGVRLTTKTNLKSRYWCESVNAKDFDCYEKIKTNGNVKRGKFIAHYDAVIVGRDQEEI